MSPHDVATALEFAGACLAWQAALGWCAAVIVSVARSVSPGRTAGEVSAYDAVVSASLEAMEAHTRLLEEDPDLRDLRVLQVSSEAATRAATTLRELTPLPAPAAERLRAVCDRMKVLNQRQRAFDA